MKFCAFIFSSLVLCNSVALPVAAGEVEVLHFWTSPGEAKSITDLKGRIGVRGHTWKDFVVVGGGGGNAMAALKERVVAGNPPSSATIKGPAIQEWAELNAFADLDSMASFDRWDSELPKVVQDQVKHKGRYVAVPVNIHRANWLWSNNEVLKKSGVNQVPSSFEDFLQAAEKIKTAGFIPIAHGGQPWQDFLLFEAVTLGVNGTDFYKKAFMKLDPTALSSQEMRKSLEAFRQVKSFTDDKSKGRNWDAATQMVIQGSAAFQFMGDWAKGEFLVAGKQPGKDFSCTAAPGTTDAFSYVIDTFAMFRLKNLEAQKAQGYLAYTLLTKEFQESFNIRKGSIPARMNVSLDKFDACAKDSARAFTATAKSNTLVPSGALDMAVATDIQAALRVVISEFWNNDALSVQDAMKQLVVASVAHKKSIKKDEFGLRAQR